MIIMVIMVVIGHAGRNGSCELVAIIVLAVEVSHDG